MKKEVSLDIIDISTEGKGVGKKDRLTYFVRGARFGDKIRAEVTDYKKNYAEAKVIDLIEVSPYYEEPACPYTNFCDGCQFQDIRYQAQVDYKKNQIIEKINRIAHESLEDIEFAQAFERYAYRNKIELKVDLYGHLSYYSRKTNANVAIKSCLIASEKINDIMIVLQEQIKIFELTGFDAKKNYGLIKNIMIRATDLGQTMVVMVLKEDYDLGEFSQSLKESGLIDSFYLSINPRRNNHRILKPRLIFGQEKIEEQMGDKRFLISPQSFFQVNSKQAYQIYQDAKALVKKVSPSSIIDLYSGISTTSILMSDLAEKILSVEIVQAAVEDGKENAKLNGIQNIDFLQGDAGQIIKDIELDLESPLLLVDPPRKGLDQAIIEVIGQSSIDNVIYISCNPATLARDIKGFKDYGFKLKHIKGYDMFVNTLHVEALVLMIRT